MIQSISEKDILERHKSRATSSKYLIIALINDSVLFRKDAYYEVEIRGIVDVFVNGLWGFNLGTTMSVNVYTLPDVNVLERYSINFTNAGMTVECKA